MSDFLPIPSATPTPKSLMVNAQAERERSSELERRADAGVAALTDERRTETERRFAKAKEDSQRLHDSTKELQAATEKGPEQVQMPDADTGPAIDPQNAKSFMFAMLGMTLIGAHGGRQHFDLALAGLDGALKGYREGSMEKVKEKQAEFKRNFDLAMEKQRAATAKYQEILQSKKLSLNEQAEQMRIQAVVNKDWDMWETAKNKDFEGMYRRAAQNAHAADQLEGKALTLQSQMDARREHAQERADAKAEKAREKTAAATDDTATETMAWDYLLKGHSPPARGGSYEKAMRRVGEIARENGMTVEQLVSASADVKTKLSAKRQFEIRAQNMQRAENQLNAEIPVMEDALKQLDLPSIPFAARGKIWALREMGNPDVTKLDQAAEAVFNEFEGIITGNPGTLNVQDVQNARHAYEQAKTPAQMHAAIDGMRRIIGNAKKSLDQTRAEIMGGIDSSLGVKPKGGTGAPGAGALPPTNAKGWTLHQDAQGRKAYVSPDKTQVEEVGGE